MVMTTMIIRIVMLVMRCARNDAANDDDGADVDDVNSEGTTGGAVGEDVDGDGYVDDDVDDGDDDDVDHGDGGGDVDDD
eukprot:8304566-Pyramimonas_sp.AAC.1